MNSNNRSFIGAILRPLPVRLPKRLNSSRISQQQKPRDGSCPLAHELVHIRYSCQLAGLQQRPTTASVAFPLRNRQNTPALPSLEHMRNPSATSATWRTFSLSCKDCATKVSAPRFRILSPYDKTQPAEMPANSDQEADPVGRSMKEHRMSFKIKASRIDFLVSTFVDAWEMNRTLGASLSSLPPHNHCGA